jgi:hypothetical protein
MSLRLPGTAVVALLAASGACRADVVTDWNIAVLNAIQDLKINPPRASRSMAIMHVAVYDAVNGISRRGKSYRVQADPPLASMEAAAAKAAHDTLAALYPSETEKFADLLEAQLAGIPSGPARDAGVAHGAQVAAAILEWRATDGSTGSSPYFPTTEPGRWRPTLPSFGPPLLPHWGDVTPFAMTSGAQFRPPACPELTTTEYATACNEVKEIGRIDSPTRTQDQTEIALIWEGGAGTPTPPGQWNQIAQALATQQGNTLEENARMFALLNMVLADAAISCWECKYEIDLWRPITAIREADTDGNPATVADPTWLPLIPTPPFPSYTSGHSTFSGSAAATLAAFFGTDELSFTFEAVGLSRDFTSLRAAAEEAGVSRIYGGIHFDFDNFAALDSGQRLGEYVFENYLGLVCRADVDGSGSLDFFDFLVFQSAFSGGEGAADFTGDGVLDLFDFREFQGEFALGCP